MSNLETHIQRLIDWVKTLDGCPVSWSAILIIEDPWDDYRGGEWKIPKESFMSIAQYENRFDELLSKGYSWININFGGIYQDNAIVFIEYPRESSGIPKDKVSVIPSGPEGHEWDLSKKLCVL